MPGGDVGTPGWPAQDSSGAAKAPVGPCGASVAGLGLPGGGVGAAGWGAQNSGGGAVPSAGGEEALTGAAKLSAGPAGGAADGPPGVTGPAGLLVAAPAGGAVPSAGAEEAPTGAAKLPGGPADGPPGVAEPAGLPGAAPAGVAGPAKLPVGVGGAAKLPVGVGGAAKLPGGDVGGSAWAGFGGRVGKGVVGGAFGGVRAPRTGWGGGGLWSGSGMATYGRMRRGLNPTPRPHSQPTPTASHSGQRSALTGYPSLDTASDYADPFGPTQPFREAITGHTAQDGDVDPA
ncbi:hypothetical protein GCM10017750_44750 [Streptomyces racemochromogenes]